MKKYIIIACIGLLYSCTTTKYVPVETVRTEYRDRTQLDSIYYRDSIYLKIKGDSVILEKYINRYIYRTKTDSIYKTDSIAVPYEVEKRVEVEKDLSWWQSLLLYTGGIAWMVLLGWVFAYIWKKGYIGKILAIIKKII